ncbi:MAG TPA: hypothetical protein DD490_24875, partial [Acidobacteria bacterium]|nr:hypothetical protein [Acidobacteriota bacterium]
SNPLNAECHERTTGEELVHQLAGRTPGAFVAGVGTGGTLIGVGTRLRREFPHIWIAAVEPAESAVMSGTPKEELRPHGISGIGDGFIPALAGDGRGGLHPLISEVICISTADALAAAQDLRIRHGLCVGVSSGANYLAARQLAERYGPVATVFPDGYTKYQSRGLQHCEPGSCPYEHDLPA